MVWKQLSLVAALAVTLSSAQENNNITSVETNSTHIPVLPVPKIAQTTSYDVNTECTYYNGAIANYNSSEWPTIWDIATSNGMNETAEFTELWDSIDWSAIPDIPVRTLNPDGSMNFTGYNTVTDPDCWWSATMCTIPKHTGNINPDIYECPEPETWGLTYDDGPNCSHNLFYDFLAENNLKASLFYIGSNVIDWPYGAMRGLNDGHHINDHTWSHRLMTTLTNQEVLAELYYTQKAIKLVTGVTPRFWRPAFGDVDDRVRAVASALNLTAIIWNLDTSDWAAGYSTTVQAVEQTYEDFITMGTNGTFATSGNIVLTHEINNTTMSLAVENLPNIMKAYKYIVPVAACHNITNPYFESEYTYPDFAEYTGISASTAGSSTNGAAPNVQVNAGSSLKTSVFTLLAIVAAVAFHM